MVWVPHERRLGVSGTTVSQTTYKSGEPAGKTGDPIQCSAIGRWGKRIKCRMKCFYETQVYGPQDQDFDVIRSDERIHGVVGSYTDQPP